MDSTNSEIWQDRQIRFDVPFAQIMCRPGEVHVDSINSVEDTKGNNGEKGVLIVTNLRLLWIAQQNQKTNLSIGYHCIISINIRLAHSRLRGNTEALYVMTKFNGTRFEFIFTSLVRRSPRLFSTVQAVFRSYETTKLYRDLKLRGAIIRDKQLIILPDEHVYSQVTGVWNLSSEQGNLGIFVISNVRLVWFATMAENFNVSIPYIQILEVRIRDSKFGKALVLTTTNSSGGYVLGFRIDPPERLQEVFQEICSLHQVFSENPIFGVRHQLEEKALPLDQLIVKRQVDDVEIVSVSDGEDAFGAYYADAGKVVDREPVYDSYLGLAVEKPLEGVTTEQLWHITT
ncbi:unnamed protein product (mitochondrion) [Plasmodiophora brassicae]|uniref:BBSome complex member BBS5 PH domain-containing protein n=1 Tax=Plasmodiophora brassicae TaxID=37360 RepID=A0A0G4IPH3_PLABS|nr:hypothetical protein PBRA_005699 [Plasmodiophora brassicae]SPR01071.1 unnamed protein product [Plasmodiophora brassicae]